MTKIFVRTSVTAVFLGLFGLFAGPSSAQSHWQFTPYVSTGGFSSELLSGVEFSLRAEQLFGRGEATIGQTVEFDSPYELQGFTGIGLSALRRWNHWGIEGTLTWIPTRAVSNDDEVFVSARIARALGFEVDPALNDPDPTPVVGRIKSTQNLVIPTVGITYFLKDWQGSGRRPSIPRFDFYATGAVGLVAYLNEDPVQEAFRDESWDTPLVLVGGGGVELNLSDKIAVRVDARGYFWETEIENRGAPIRADDGTLIGFGPGELESNWQRSFVFSPGFTIRR